MAEKLYYKYWGKARREDDDVGEPYHLLVYHSLDVAAVASEWWNSSSVIQRRFNSSRSTDNKIRAWILFFISIHDLGKFDVRFQMKVPDIATSLYENFSDSDPSEYRKYWHGEYSYHWLFEDFAEEFDWRKNPNDFLEPSGEEIWRQWEPWLQAVAGHHGIEPQMLIKSPMPRASEDVITHDREARKSFVFALEALFLKPARLTIKDQPPACDLLFVAGFCSVCDWLGSTVTNANDESFFSYKSTIDLPETDNLNTYFESRLPIARKLLNDSGLLQETKTTGGMQSLFPEYVPHQVQTLVEDIPVEVGLTLIEAPTGSGKTEAALAYASHLLAAGIAESIIFALPTQATANAMLERLIDVSKNLYEGADLVLAHGKARFNNKFIDLKKTVLHQSSQDKEHELEASIQCSQWLGQSRKRVFLGQIGVCTIDQVLISVLPVKHRFVRSFGLGKSVLIVDEVHAYDSYMYGLLNQVLINQKAMLGSVILLSATLPLFQREQLISTWGKHTSVFSTKDEYPLISHVTNSKPTLFPLKDQEKALLKQQPKRVVSASFLHTSDILPDQLLLQQIIDAANNGANIVVICNLVADAQSLANALRQLINIPIDLFHSRYRFKDRQEKENEVLKSYGKGKQRKQGGILVATQVVEQSLDLDFDWMITQLCPMDLFFQRLGRLHRHQRSRPEGFEQPKCTVLLPENHDYQLHKLIYGNKKAPNSRILWRTETLLKEKQELHFPEVYRPMIEKVYQQEAWANEPEHIIKEYELFEMEEDASRFTARDLTKIENAWDDDDSNVSALTRDGEMSLNIVPIVSKPDGNCFLESEVLISSIEEWKLAEQLMLNTTPVPASWESSLNSITEKQDDVLLLKMTASDDQHWETSSDKADFTYTQYSGLERQNRENE